MKNRDQIMRTLLVALLALLLPAQALAAGRIDLTKDCGLTLTYRDNGVPLVGAVFSLYRVADVDEYGELTVTEAFSQFNVDIRGRNDEAWWALASTLEGYVLRDQVVPADSGITDLWGQLAFPTPGKTLTPGLYLVLGSRHQQGGMIYDAQAFMVLLPTLDQEANDWDYHVTAEPKHSVQPAPEEGDTVDRRVLKVWRDAGYEAQRPQSVTAQLLKDGVVVDAVTLSAANNWRYAWEGLDSGSQWLVVEAAPGAYTVEIVREGDAFVVVNTVQEPDTPPGPTPPDDTDIPDGPVPDEDTEPDPGTDIPDWPPPLGPALPQTGQLWWPVPLLLCAGLFFVAAGLIRRRGASNEEKQG